MEPVPATGLFGLIAKWWKDERLSHGLIPASKHFASAVKQFLRDSLPKNKRQRYGDMDYDWDFRVDTTSAVVNWPTRLLGTLHSPYQPTEPALFHEMLANLKIDFSKFTFIDIGSGKGRALLMAADYPFHRIIGVELLPELHRAAEDNLKLHHSTAQQCFSVETVWMNACDYVFPPDPIVLYMFNPLPESQLQGVVANLVASLKINPRLSYVLYHSPENEQVFENFSWFRKIVAMMKYSIFESEITLK